MLQDIDELHIRTSPQMQSQPTKTLAKNICLQSSGIKIHPFWTFLVHP